jgi:hypothetical protein
MGPPPLPLSNKLNSLLLPHFFEKYMSFFMPTSKESSQRLSNSNIDEWLASKLLFWPL